MISQIQFGNIFNSGGRQVLGGSSSGYDTEALVNGLVEARRLPAVQLETKLEENAAKQAALGDFQAILERFKDAANFLRNPPGVQNATDDIFDYRTGVLSSNSSVDASNYIGVTVEPGASLSNYELEVDVLATYNIKTTNTFALASLSTSAVGGTGPLNAGTWAIGASGVNVTLDAGDTLQEVINKINAVSSQSKIQASAIQVSNGNYRLQLKSTTTGAAMNYALPGGMLNVGLSIDQSAVNAEFKLDGTVITRATNTISDAVEGITFNLKQVTPGGTLLNLDVRPDTEIVKNGIINFVDSYNELRLFVSRQTQLGDNGLPTEDAVLSSSASLRNTLTRITGEMSRVVEGLNTNPNRLADLGITFDDFPGDDENPFTRNIMILDENTLDGKLAADFDAVRKVFAFDMTSSDSEIQVFRRTNSLDVSSFSLNIDVTGGIYQATYNNGSGPVTVNLNGSAIPGGGVLITGADDTVFEGLELIYSGSTNTTSNITITQGIGDRIYNTLNDALDEDNGTVAVEIESLSSSKTRMEEEIARIDQMIDRYREQLLQKFSNLENAIASLNTILQSLDAQAQAQANS